MPYSSFVLTVAPDGKLPVSQLFRFGGGGIFTEDGFITFKSSASFVGNEAEQSYGENSVGIEYDGGQGGGLRVGNYDGSPTVVFEGPSFFVGNKAAVR